jgi:hypothetical protein
MCWAGVLFPYVKTVGVYTCPDDNTNSSATNTAVSYQYNMNMATTTLASKYNAPANTVMLCEVSGRTVTNIAAGETDTTYYNVSSAGNGPFYLPGNTEAIIYQTGLLGGEPLTPNAGEYQSFTSTGWHTLAKLRLKPPSYRRRVVTKSDGLCHIPPCQP